MQPTPLSKLKLNTIVMSNVYTR